MLGAEVRAERSSMTSTTSCSPVATSRARLLDVGDAVILERVDAARVQKRDQVRRALARPRSASSSTSSADVRLRDTVMLIITVNKIGPNNGPSSSEISTRRSRSGLEHLLAADGEEGAHAAGRSAPLHGFDENLLEAAAGEALRELGRGCPSA